jgi:hypothetical protein
MTQITSQTLKTMRPQIEDALKELGERLGIDFSVGRGTHGGITGSFALEMVARDTETGKSGEQRVFEQYARLYGLTAEDYGREFTFQRRRFKLVGFYTNSKINCLKIADAKSGTEYKLDMESYKAAVAYEEILTASKKAA